MDRAEERRRGEEAGGLWRLEGATAATALGSLHETARLYVNFFQPSFKLKSKTREGAKVSKEYDRPTTPYKRLLASNRVTVECKERLRDVYSALDPVQLLNRIREAQRVLAGLEVDGNSEKAADSDQELSRFVKSLSTAWRDGEVRPTHRKRASGPRPWRTRRDPFEAIWPLVEQWLNEQPDRTAKDLFGRLQAEVSEPFAPGQLRTLQRRVKEWRIEIARRLVLGSGLEGEQAPPAPIPVESIAELSEE